MKISHSEIFHFLFYYGATATSEPSPPQYRGFMIVLRHSSGRVISPMQRPLPHKTQHSQETKLHVPAGFELTTLASEQPQIHASDGAA